MNEVTTGQARALQCLPKIVALVVLGLRIRWDGAMERHLFAAGRQVLASSCNEVNGRALRAHDKQVFAVLLQPAKCSQERVPIPVTHVVIVEAENLCRSRTAVGSFSDRRSKLLNVIINTNGKTRPLDPTLSFPNLTLARLQPEAHDAIAINTEARTP